MERFEVQGQALAVGFEATTRALSETLMGERMERDRADRAEGKRSELAFELAQLRSEVAAHATLCF